MICLKDAFSIILNHGDDDSTARKLKYFSSHYEDESFHKECFNPIFSRDKIVRL